MSRAFPMQSEYPFDDFPVGWTQFQIHPRKPLSELNQVPWDIFPWATSWSKTIPRHNNLSFHCRLPPPSVENVIVSNICLQVSFAIADVLLMLSLPLLFALVCMSLVDVLSHLDAHPSSKLHVHRRCLSSDDQSLQHSSNRSSTGCLVLHFERV